MIAPGRSAVSDVAAQGITRTLERKGLRVRGRVTIIPAVYGELTEASLDAVLDDPNVEYVEADVPMPLAVRSSGATFTYAEDTPWGVPRVTAPEAWALGDPEPTAPASGWPTWIPAETRTIPTWSTPAVTTP